MLCTDSTTERFTYRDGHETTEFILESVSNTLSVTLRWVTLVVTPEWVVGKSLSTMQTGLEQQTGWTITNSRKHCSIRSTATTNPTSTRYRSSEALCRGYQSG